MANEQATTSNETLWETLQADITNCPDLLISRYERKAKVLQAGMAKLQEHLAHLPDRERRAASALVSQRLVEVLSDFHLAVIGLISKHRQKEAARTGEHRQAVLASFRHDFAEVVELYDLL